MQGLSTHVTPTLPRRPFPAILRAVAKRIKEAYLSTMAAALAAAAARAGRRTIATAATARIIANNHGISGGIAAAQTAWQSSSACLLRAPFEACGSLGFLPKGHMHLSCRFISSGPTVAPDMIRNFAIIAHVDHGKTTLVDKILSQNGAAFSEDRVMDNNALEKERGITISSKYTSLSFRGHTVNVVDTPGHADFGGEVERVLGMVDGAVLLVDANEGALSQTKFVLEKALKAGLSPIVVLNKVDRESSTPERCSSVESDIFDLFASLGASEAQLDFQVLYASARNGWVSRELPPPGQPPEPPTLEPLMETILQHVPAPPVDRDAPFSMLVAMLARDPFVGRLASGRVHSGVAKVGDKVKILRHTGEPGSGDVRITKIFKRIGTADVEVQEAAAGDIVMVAGAEHVGVADTIGAPAVKEHLPPGHIDPPTLSMVFSPNDSPMAGLEGSEVTANKIADRLRDEAENSVSVKVSVVEGSGGERFEVQARGELQLGLLIENMRREGFEFSVSPPKVVLRHIDGVKMEPIEEVVVECEEVHTGAIIEGMTHRKAELTEMVPVPESAGRMRLCFNAPSRGLLGYRTIFASVTRGSGIMNRAFAGYEAYRGGLDGVRKGVLVSMTSGKTTAFSLNNLEPRGVMFSHAGQQVYSGMIIGEHSKEGDMEVNPVKEKPKTNIRASGHDENIKLTPPRIITLEDAIGYVAEDELIEATPLNIRLRKVELDSSKRKRGHRAAAK